MICAVLTDRRFWRFLLLSMINVGTKMLSLPLLLPPILINELGPETRYGLILSLSPLLTLVFLYITSPCSLRLAALTQITLGAFFSTIAPLALLVRQTYQSFILFLALTALGESVASPRMY